jgi:hypothetical protein
MSLVPDISFCVICMKKVLSSEKSLQCGNTCERLFHAACINVSDSEYRRLKADSGRQWQCDRFDCIKLNLHPLNKLLNRFDTISSQMATIITKLDDLASIHKDISSINTQINQVNEKLTNIEPRIIDSENRIKTLEDEVLVLKNGNPSSSNVETILEEINDRELRSRNIIFYNVPESSSSSTSIRIDHDKSITSKLIHSFCTSDPDCSFKLYRVGRPVKNKPRPLKVIFQTPNPVMDICKNFDPKRLVDIDPSLENVSLSRDRTLHERKYLSDLRATLKERTDKGENDLTIKYVNGTPKIVKQTPKNG